MTEFTLKAAWPIVKAKESEYSAALSSCPDVGLVKPVGKDAWMAAVYAEFQRNVRLCQAAIQAPDTVRECLSVAAGLALIPSGAAGQFYLIPRRNKREQRMTCTFIVGYKGLTELAYRHPRVHKVEAFLVMEGDEFDWQPGKDARHRYGPSDRIVVPDLSNVIGAYSRTVLTIHNTTQVDADPVVEYMTTAEILALKKRSASERAGAFGPWKTDPGRMARKGPIRRACNGGSVPQSASLIMALSHEDHQEARMQAELQTSLNPTATAGNTLRQAAGLDAKPVLELPDFDLVEHAIAFVNQADRAQLDAVTSNDLGFTGEDLKALHIAVEEREGELETSDA